MFKKIFIIFMLFSGIASFAGEQVKARIYPVDFQKGYCAILPGLPCVLDLDLEGDRNYLKNKLVKFEITLPETLSFIGACYGMPYAGKDGYIPVAETKQTAKNTWSVKLPKIMLNRLKKKGYYWENMERIIVDVKRGAKIGKYPVSYKITIDGKTVVSSSFTMEILPALTGKRSVAKKFFLGTSEYKLLPFPNVNRAYDSFLSTLTTNHAYQMHRWVGGFPSKFVRGKYYFIGMGTTIPKVWGWWRDKNNKYMKNFDLAKDKNGKIILHHNRPIVEAEYIIADPDGLVWEDLVLKHFKKIFGTIKEGSVSLNFEPGHIYSKWSMTLKNRAKFAEFAKLNHTPESIEIEMKYAKQWLKFRIWQNNRIVKKYVQFMRKHFPHVKATVCTATLSPQVSPNCAVDPRLYDNFVDGHWNMFYASGLKVYKWFEYNCIPAIKKPQIILIDPSEHMMNFYKRYSPEKVKQTVLMSAVFGAKGIAVWPSIFLDGRYYVKLAEAYDLVGKLEDVFNTRKCDKILSFTLANTIVQTLKEGNKKIKINYPSELKNNAKVHLHYKAGVYVISAFNFNKRASVIINVKIKDFKLENPTCVEMVSRHLLENANPATGFMFKVNANSMAVVKISKDAAKGLKKLSQASLKRQAEADRAVFRKQMTFGNFVKVKNRIRWGALPFSSKRAIRLQGSGGFAFVDFDYAEVKEWNPNVGAKFNGTGSIGDIVFEDRSQTMPVKFNLSHYELRRNIPTLTFNAKIGDFVTESPIPNPLMGLNIRRVITLKTGKKINIKTIFTNNSPMKKDMKLRLRLRNIVDSKQFEVLFCKKVLPLTHFDLRYSKDDYALSKNVFHWDGTSVTAMTKHKNFIDQMNFTFDKNFSGVFSWYAPELRTIEGTVTAVLRFGETREFNYQVTFERK